ncbi:hypothetical protein RFI_29279 [Reticulomyxa filosa]|uniref:Uncharacterized protein n=1 Tax=Reticulomyxa filosa TaxID=46433 RepID=X6M1S2_RETFI|nr:hypothetical protein RFI_29279 [Reticulomyxa filosa]|eukprot:ETO08113.1 hypothetical protein RFI_29279 [Reticulomyxa filosa]
MKPSGQKKFVNERKGNMDDTKKKEFRKWLASNRWEVYESKCVENGVTNLDDLKQLKTEKEILELAGTGNIDMKDIDKQKFVKAVLALNLKNSISEDLREWLAANKLE